MAKNKQCAYCGTKDRNEPYRRMPNGCFACEDCHTLRNPMKVFGRAHIAWNNRNNEDAFVGQPEARQKVKNRGKPPPLHHVYSNPIIRQMYKNLMKKGKVFGANVSSVDGA